MNQSLNSEIDFDLDKSNMKEAISSFPFQIEEAIRNYKKIKFNNQYDAISNVLVLGMGGSAIGADLTKVLVQNSCIVPIVVNRSYTIPNWVGPNTLVVASSYSGNTEETLEAFSQCKKRTSKIIIISTGGELVLQSNKKNYDKIILPKGYQPRAALGYSFTYLIILLEKIKLIPKIILEEINNSVRSIKNLGLDLSKAPSSIINIVQKIHSTCPIIYGSEELTSVVALRFKGQLAENGKILSFNSNFPEHNHNEIEGWTLNKSIIKKFSLIWIKDIEEDIRIKNRMHISSNIIKRLPKYELTIQKSGATIVERLLKLIHFVDWISYYVALYNKIDPTPVKRIEKLKIQIKEMI